MRNCFLLQHFLVTQAIHTPNKAELNKPLDCCA